MYREIKEFVCSAGKDSRLYKDGEFITAVVVGIVAGIWLYIDQSQIERIRAHLGELLSITSIIFGFVLATLFSYIQATTSWSKDEMVEQVAESLVDHHVWTILSLLVLIGYVLVLWTFGTSQYLGPSVLMVTYALLVFQVSYCGFQVLNQVLTIRWAFRRRHRLSQSPKNESQKADLNDGEEGQPEK